MGIVLIQCNMRCRPNPPHFHPNWHPGRVAFCSFIARHMLALHKPTAHICCVHICTIHIGLASLRSVARGVRLAEHSRHLPCDCICRTCGVWLQRMASCRAGSSSSLMVVIVCGRSAKCVGKVFIAIQQNSHEDRAFGTCVSSLRRPNAEPENQLCHRECVCVCSCVSVGRQAACLCVCTCVAQQ